ncbi:hypothetical protein B0H99_104170 [Planomicrobium soli]|uniref:Uncharacterized protein n=1 Tax=Planomicrobium soli TaxID=1176648 RepID=A0A2P8H3B6_9BACL|nr:hypothetical protein [Planomicrobium soli]PSL40708.1 hypothetical protein B0H99_104170 [Planomicrobium soli]
MYAHKSLIRLGIIKINKIKYELAEDFNKLENELEKFQYARKLQLKATATEEEKKIREDLATLYIRINIIEITAIFKNLRYLASFVLGLSIIASCYGIWYVFNFIDSFPNPSTTTPSTTTRPFDTSVAALIIIPNVIGGLLFVLYSKIIDQYKYFYEKLDNVTDIRTADLYIKAIENADLKITLQKAFVENLLKRSSEEISSISSTSSTATENTGTAGNTGTAENTGTAQNTGTAGNTGNTLAAVVAAIAAVLVAAVVDRNNLR